MQADLRVEYVAIDKLKPFVDNPREHSERNINDIKRSISRFGFTNPVLVRREDNMIIAGHGRIEAAMIEGLDTIPVIYLDMSDNDAKLYSITDNRTGETSEWDLLALKELTEALDNDGMEIEDSGFEIAELEELLESVEPEVEVEEDDFDTTPQDDAVSQTGDLWHLGEHRLLCGDSTVKEDVERVMGGEKADMVYTDPPYGVSIVSRTGGVGGGTEGKYAQIVGDESNKTAIAAYNMCVEMGFESLVFWGGNYYADYLPASRCWIVWDKQAGKHTTFADCELAWTSCDKNARIFTHIWDGFRRDSERGEMRTHPAQKPIMLAAEILQFFDAGRNVLDLFLGSGSTLIACEQLSRKCYAIEIAPQYIDVAVRRFVKYVGTPEYACCERDGERIPYTELFDESMETPIQDA